MGTMSSNMTPLVSGYTKYTTTTLTAQKNACIKYRRHLIASCRTGVISPTSQLNAQFVAVERLAPLARILRGIISGGYNHGMGPKLAWRGGEGRYPMNIQRSR